MHPHEIEFDFRDIDDDLRCEAIDERRARSRATRCQCGDDLPGRCPGPAACSYSNFNTDEEEDATDDED